MKAQFYYLFTIVCELLWRHPPFSTPPKRDRIPYYKQWLVTFLLTVSANRSLLLSRFLIRGFIVMISPGPQQDSSTNVLPLRQLSVSFTCYGFYNVTMTFTYNSVHADPIESMDFHAKKTGVLSRSHFYFTPWEKCERKPAGNTLLLLCHTKKHGRNDKIPVTN